eukprot:Hpha_TRINITY_DN11626_c0_g1::TRINITY_DN11626_c0_g1_i2::g.48981::m.48981
MLATIAAAAVAAVPTVQVAPGVNMPMINLGTCCGSKPSVGVQPWIAAGGHGIDTAWDYFDQKDIATAIKASGVKREDLFILTKVPPVLDTMNSVKADLKQLGIDYADVILVHNPTTKAENARQYAVLEQALAMNLTRAIGISDFSKSQVADLLETAKVKPALNQCKMSVGSVDEENLAFCKENGIAYEAWNVMKGCNRTNPAVVNAATAHNVSTFQICMRYIVERGALMAVGTGADAASAPAFSKENMGIFDFKLTADEVAALKAV